MDVLYALEKATAAEILERLPDPPGYSAVRATLRILEHKGHIRHQEEGLRYAYMPVISKETARRSAWKHLIRTFFEGSAIDAVSAFIDESGSRLSKEELDRLARLIDKARKEGR